MYCSCRTAQRSKLSGECKAEMGGGQMEFCFETKHSSFWPLPPAENRIIFWGKTKFGFKFPPPSKMELNFGVKHNSLEQNFFLQQQALHHRGIFCERRNRKHTDNIHCGVTSFIYTLHTSAVVLKHQTNKDTSYCCCQNSILVYISTFLVSIHTANLYNITGYDLHLGSCAAMTLALTDLHAYKWAWCQDDIPIVYT